MTIPLQFILLQILTMLLTIMIEAYMFNWQFNINRQKSIELSCLINFTSYLISWLYFLIINGLISDRIVLRLQIISYVILGKITDLSLFYQISAFVISTMLFNFVIIVTIEFLGFNLASKLILIKQGGELELYDFLMNIIRENNAKKLLTILLANLYSYLATIFIYFLSQIKTILN